MTNPFSRFVNRVRAAIQKTVETFTRRFEKEPGASAPTEITITETLYEFEPGEEQFETDEGEEITDIPDSENYRGPFMTREEADNYAEEIPVPTRVGRDRGGLWAVEVVYEQ